jgi:hypothetical protein
MQERSQMSTLVMEQKHHEIEECGWYIRLYTPIEDHNPKSHTTNLFLRILGGLTC